MPRTTETETRIVSVAELSRRSDLSVATLYRLMGEDGGLDRPAKITRNRVGWSSSYVDKWLADRLGATA